MEKKNMKRIAKYILLAAGLQSMAACSESFLDPDPLSFFEPSVTFNTPEGL